MIANKTRLKKFPFVYFIFAIFSALSVTMELYVPNFTETDIANSFLRSFYKIIDLLNLELSGKGSFLTLLILLFTLVYWVFGELMQIPSIRYSKGLSLFLSFMYVAGMAFYYENSLSVFFTSSIRFSKMIFCLMGYWIIFYECINAFYYLLHSNADISVSECKLIRLYRRHPYLVPWLLIIIVWSIHLLLRYPGAMSYDNANEICYYFGHAYFTTAQPVFHTILFGSFIQFGLFLGNENIGLFLFVLMQSIIMSTILAFTIFQMRKWHVARWIRLLALFIYMTAPYYTGYVSFPIKDYLYTAFFVILMVYTLKCDSMGGIAEMQFYEKVIWILSATFLILFRNNGIYIYFVFALIMLIRLPKNLGYRAKNLFSIIFPFLLSGIITVTIMNVWNIDKDSPKEMLSLPFQQTARYVRDYGYEVTEEEKEIIDHVLRYDELAAVYSELTSDPVKSTYHDPSTNELISYFKVWFHQFLRHPLCYLEATWNQNYYLFSPKIDNIAYNKDCTVASEIFINNGMSHIIEFKLSDEMEQICTIMVGLYTLLTEAPVIGLLSNVAVYNILLFVFTCFFMGDFKQRHLLSLLPLWFTLLIIIASPQIQNQPRYAFPIIYTMPTLLAFYYKKCRS